MRVVSGQNVHDWSWSAEVAVIITSDDGAMEQENDKIR